MTSPKPTFQIIIDTEAPLADNIFGNRYRCACTLRDGTYLPCVVLQSRSKIVELAKRRIKEEMVSKGRIGGPDPFGQVVSSFVTSGNRIADYDVVATEKSPFAISQTLLSKIHGETWMSWTGWVFEMNDGCLFSCGSTFDYEFFPLPDGYGFQDVSAVHNHSYVNGLEFPRSCPTKRTSRPLATLVRNSMRGDPVVDPTRI